MFTRLSFTDGFRSSDWVAVYAFSDTLRELQGFTRDKDAARKATSPSSQAKWV